MKNTLLSLCALSLCTPAFTAFGDLVSYKKVTSFSKQELEALLKQYSMKDLEVSVDGADFYKIVYETSNPSGHICNCSGAVVIPKKEGKNFPLLSYNHGTMCTREDVPSKVNFQILTACAAFTTGGYIVASPDYLGLGDSELFYHPYCHASSLTSASVDMLKAAKHLCQQLQISLSQELFVTGYSEGGMASMALARELEKENYPDLSLTASAPMAGPYDLSETSFKVGLGRPSPRASTYVAYIFKAYNMVYPDLFNSFNEVFEAPFGYSLNVLFDGSQSMYDIQHALPMDPKAMLKKEFLLLHIANPDSKLVARLKENNTYDWVPKKPLLLVGAKGDRDVAYANSEVAYQYMKAQGANKVSLLNVGDSLDHLTGSSLCHMEARRFFDGGYKTDLTP